MLNVNCIVNLRSPIDASTKNTDPNESLTFVSVGARHQAGTPGQGLEDQVP